MIQTATIVLVRSRGTPIRTLAFGPVADMAAARRRSGRSCGSWSRRTRGSLLGPTVDLQLGEDGVLDGGVAGVSRMKRTHPPAVVGLVAAGPLDAVPGRDRLAVEGVPGLLSGDVAFGGLGVRGALAGDLPGVVEVPEVDGVEVGVGVDLVFVCRAGFAEAVAGEAGVDVDVADFGFVFVGFGGGFVEAVDFADAVVEVLAQVFAEVGVDVGPFQVESASI